MMPHRGRYQLVISNKDCFRYKIQIKLDKYTSIPFIVYKKVVRREGQNNFDS